MKLDVEFLLQRIGGIEETINILDKRLEEIKWQMEQMKKQMKKSSLQKEN
jgi:hypothetical protein